LQPVKPLADPLSTLKVLIDSSAPIVVMETVEEVCAVRLVRVACASLNLAAFEWSIASGLVRCGNEGNPVMVLRQSVGWVAVLGIGLDASVGEHAAQLVLPTGVAERTFTVGSKQYSEQHLNVAPGQVDLSAEDLARTCHAHPTRSEAIKEAALAVGKRAIHM